jgi:hypothetical protein
VITSPYNPPPRSTRETNVSPRSKRSSRRCEQELSALKSHLLELQTKYFEELGPPVRQAPRA